MKLKPVWRSVSVRCLNFAVFKLSAALSSTANIIVIMSSSTSSSSVSTKPFAGQKPGTSGLRKKVNEFLETPHYVENFLQCTLEAVGDQLKGATLVVGGDGRFGVKDTVAKIIRMAAANGVSQAVTVL